jgi:hypothetical protein
MTVPSNTDIAKRKANRAKLAKKITDDGHLKEAELVRIVRKAIDAAWMTAANKLVFLEDRVVPDMNPNTRTKWLVQCNHCKKMFKLTDVQIDHRQGEFACTKREDFYPYILSRLDVNFDDLQVLCIEDHQIKTLAERQGITFEEARLEKQVIAVCKGSTSSVKAFLIERGMEPARNANERKKQVRECLLNEK